MMAALKSLWPFFQTIDHSILYAAALQFYGLYPIAMSWLWISLSLFFRRNQEDAQMQMQAPYPLVSILVPCFAEEDTINGTIRLCWHSTIQTSRSSSSTTARRTTRS